MQGSETLYFLKNGVTGKFLTVINDTVQEVADPTPLQFAPEGWEDVSIQTIRNIKYFGLERTFSIPLNFVEDGARILKDFCWKRGMEQKVLLCIGQQQLYLDNTHYGFYYSMLFEGEIDFSQLVQSNPRVTANIMEGGLAKLIKARENTTYEIPLAVPERQLIRMDGVKLLQRSAWLINNGALLNNLGGASMAMNLLAVEAITSIGAISQERIKSGNSPDALYNTNNAFLITGSQPTTITLKWNFKVILRLAFGNSPINPTRAVLNLHMVSDTAPTGTAIPLDSIPTQDPVFLYNNKHTLEGSITVNVPAETRLILYLSTTQNRNFTFFDYDNDGEFSAEYDYTHRTTFIRCVTAEYILQQLIMRMTDGKYTASSALLAKYRNIKITCGDGLRGIKGAVIKTSWNDFFKSMNTVLCVGTIISKGNLIFEAKTDLVDYTSYEDLGECADLKVSFHQEYLYSSIKIGYPEQTYNDVNGRQEFNNTLEFTTPITRVNKEMDLVSVYRADCYGIEFLRINLEGKTTTDNAGDNDVFMIHTLPDPSGYGGLPLGEDENFPIYHLDRGLNQYASGLLTKETVFNLWFSPKQCFYRNGPFIRSHFYRQDTDWIKFQSTQKNSALEIRPPLSRAIIEKADESIALLGNRLFVPVQIEFNTRVPYNLLSILAANPLKSFKTFYLGIELKGISNKLGIRPETNTDQVFQLLVSPDTNLETLIDIFD